MKKITALLLAILTVFSVCSVAMTGYAADSIDEAIKKSLLNVDSSIDVKKYGVSVATAENAVTKIVDDNPQIHYLNDFSCTYDGKTGIVSLIRFTYDASKETIKKEIAEIDKVVSEIKKLITPGMSDIEKALVIHDYIVLNSEYNLNSYSAGSVYGILVKGKGKCLGYASAYQYLMSNILGIKCKLVKPKITSDEDPHVWNCLTINGKNYYVDTTWDDPVSYQITDYYGHVFHNFFLVSCKNLIALQKQYSVNGKAMSWDDKLFNCSDTKYDSYFWSDVMSAIPSAGGKYYYVKNDGIYSAKVSSPNNASKIINFSEKWYLKKGYYYNENFSSLSYCDGKVYYSTPTKINAYDINTKKTQTVKSIASGTNSIYGFCLNNVQKTITYKTSSDPYEKGSKTTFSINSSSATVPAVSLNSVAASKTGVTVKWTAAKNISGYTVYRKEGSSSWKSIAKVTSDKTSYTDKTAVSGKTYTYTVRAYKGSTYGGYNKTGLKITFLSVPTCKVSSANKPVKISWNKISGAKNYGVYRKLSTNKSYTKIATVTSTSYSDSSVSNGKSYNYCIIAFNGSYKSATSNVVTVNMPATVPTVSLKSVAASKSGVTVKWAAAKNISGYTVYRKEGSSSWKSIAKVASDKTSYTDKTAVSGKTYSYTVRAYKGSTYGGYNKTGLKVTFLSVPACKVTSTKKTAKVSWNKISGAKNYGVYRKLSTDKSYTKIATVTGTSYTDKNVTAGKKYDYCIIAFNGSFKSATSNVVTVKINK